jgi:hypothetical protein
MSPKEPTPIELPPLPERPAIMNASDVKEMSDEQLLELRKFFLHAFTLPIMSLYEQSPRVYFVNDWFAAMAARIETGEIPLYWFLVCLQDYVLISNIRLRQLQEQIAAPQAPRMTEEQFQICKQELLEQAERQHQEWMALGPQ